MSPPALRVPACVNRVVGRAWSHAMSTFLVKSMGVLSSGTLCPCLISPGIQSFFEEWHYPTPEGKIRCS